jgi:hypothetical protein
MTLAAWVPVRTVGVGHPVVASMEGKDYMGAMQNVLQQPADYKIEKTSLGTWRRFLSPSGLSYAEFTSHRRYFGLPLVSYTSGRCPETGRCKMAKGVVAIGRFALGVVPIGQVAIGVFPIGQLSLGLVFGIGQLATGFFAVGQAAIGMVFGFGQLATGVVAIGQLALGWHVLAQIGVGAEVWRWSEFSAFIHSLMGA